MLSNKNGYLLIESSIVIFIIGLIAFLPLKIQSVTNNKVDKYSSSLRAVNFSQNFLEKLSFEDLGSNSFTPGQHELILSIEELNNNANGSYKLNWTTNENDPIPGIMKINLKTIILPENDLSQRFEFTLYREMDLI